MGHYCITTANADFAPLFVDDLKKARAEQAGKLGQHYCPATFFEKRLGDAYVESLPCIWIDVDVPDNYTTFDEAMAEWSTTLSKMRFTEPSIWVASGSGLHLYWYFGEQRQTKDWIILRDGMVRAFMDNGLKADFAHTHPSAYIRTIGSINEKTNKKVIPIKTGDKVKFTEMVIKVIDYVSGGKKSNALTLSKTYTGKTPKWELVCEKCEALRWASDPVNQPNVPENLWRALLSNVYVCENGENLIQEVSKHHPNYDPMKTSAKAQGSIPYSCQKIRECGGLCSKCKHLVKSPIALGHAEEVKKEESKEVLDNNGNEAKQIGKYIVSENGVSCPTKDMDDMIQITSVPINIGDVVENTMGDAVSGCYLKWKNSNGVQRNEFIPYDILCSQADCVKWLANRNLMNKVFNLKEFVGYVLCGTSMIEHGNLRAGASRYGWQGEDLIMPYGKVTENGIEEAYIIGDLPKNVNKPTDESRGCLEMVFNYLLQKNNGLLVAPMLMSMTAPLFPLLNINPVVFYLSGMSGSGKSTVGFASMCLYGFTDKFNMVEGSTTMNSIMDKMSSLNCLTLCLDEVSLGRRSDMREIIMQAVNGRPKGRLNKAAKQNTKEAWFSPLLITSNPSYSEENDEIDTAQGVRMVELSMYQSLKISNEDIARIKNELVDDGARIALYIVKNKQKLMKSVQNILNMITEDDRYDPSMRFLAATWAVIKSGMKIIYDLYPSLFQRIMYVLPEIEKRVLWDKVPKGSVEMIDEAVNRWINDNNDKISMWTRFGCSNEEKMKGVLARYEAEDNVIYIQASAMRQILMKCGESSAAFKLWAEKRCRDNGQTSRKRLIKKSSPVNVYGYNVDKKIFTED